MKLPILFLVFVSAPTAQASLSDFDKGRCELLNYQAEKVCVELVCGDTDRGSIADCRRSGEMTQVMKSCRPEILKTLIKDYNIRSTAQVSNCNGYNYDSKF